MRARVSSVLCFGFIHKQPKVTASTSSADKSGRNNNFYLFEAQPNRTLATNTTMVHVAHHMTEVAIVLAIFFVFMVILRYFINICCIGYCMLGEPPCDNSGAAQPPPRIVDVDPDYDVAIAAKEIDVSRLLRPVTTRGEASAVCTICLDSLYDDNESNNTAISETRTCQHQFHDRCIRKWISRPSANGDWCRCPNCNVLLRAQPVQEQQQPHAMAV